jgi:hypothetical protein
MPRKKAGANKGGLKVWILRTNRVPRHDGCAGRERCATWQVKLSPEQLQECKEAFLLYDVDGSGAIDENELFCASPPQTRDFIRGHSLRRPRLRSTFVAGPMQLNLAPGSSGDEDAGVRPGPEGGSQDDAARGR